MNRQIKFRAWDGKMMVDLNRLWWCDEYTSMCFSTEEGGICGFSEIGFDYDEEKIIIMQFTGLLDKNGKEIYEGDILKISNIYFVENQSIFRYVKYESRPPACGFVLCEKLDMESYNEHMGRIGKNDNEYSIEIIGNIYENLDLIK